jgi:CxxC-x17-CxxC domain-containing protein
MEFTDRILKCSDCGNEFIFTAGEQLFFFDKQFKNDPKRCKLCKAKRAGLGRSVNGASSVALPLSRTETRTKCSACGVETTVPFKPTQGRPVLCRSCFQLKRVPAAVAAVARMDTPTGQITQAVEQVLATEAAPPVATTGGNGVSTRELIAETPAPVVAEVSEASTALIAAAQEAPQA